MPTLMVAVGDTLLGKYRLERELGRGGMGQVFAAQHLELHDQVAIKLVLPEYAQHETIVRRFVREARAAARIKNDHVVRVTDVGKLPSGEPYMVMELLDGADLEHVVDRNGPLPLADVVEFVVQAIEAIAEAHAHGIVHRDLKPANLFLTRKRTGEACVKVLDFGISKFGDGTGSEAGMTHTHGTMMGSPLYMSPEQLQSVKHVDMRTDVWALGVILYELLTNEHPFVGATIPQVVAAVMSVEPIPIRRVRPDVPVEIEAAISKCLQKSTAERYANVTQLAAAIAPFGPPSAERSLQLIRSALPENTVAAVASADASQDQPSVSIATAALEIKNAQTLAVPTSARGETRITGESIDAPVEATTSRKRGAWWVAGAVALVLGAGVAFAMRGAAMQAAPAAAASTASAREKTPEATGNAAAATAKVAPSMSVEATARSAYEEASAPLAAPAASASTSASAGEARAKPITGTVVAAPRPSSKASAAPTASVAAPPPAAANCSPPYRLDAAGHRIPKPECL